MLKLFKRAKKEEPIFNDDDLEPVGNTSKLFKSIDESIGLAMARTLYPDANINDLSDFDKEEAEYLKDMGYAVYMILRGFRPSADDLKEMEQWNEQWDES